MKIKVKKIKRIKKVYLSDKLYGKLVLVLPELAAFADDDVRVSIEIYRVNPDAVPV